MEKSEKLSERSEFFSLPSLAAVRSPVRSRQCIFASFVARQKKARGSEGNIRMNYALDPTDNQVKILNEDHYYPFGLKHTNYNSDVKNFQEDPGFSTLRIIQVPSEGNTYRYKYNGKEYQDELGLNVYDYGARFYDPATGRWYSVDAMAEKYADMSPYNYALDNPVIFVDPDGNEVEMCCDGLKKYLNQVYTGAADRANQYLSLRTLASAAYPLIAVHEATKDPVGTLKGGAEFVFNSSMPGMIHNAMTNPKALGGTVTDGLVVAITHKVGTTIAPETASTATASGGLADDAIVVRGGTNTPAAFEGGSGVYSKISDKSLSGISVNSGAGKSVQELSNGIPHNKIGTTTVGEIRKAGGNVVSSPTKNNPNHATMSIPNSQKASDLMRIVKNPNKRN